MAELRAAFYGDDVTGSVDALLQFSRYGWTGRLFTAMPAAEELSAAAAGVDVVGIAGIARSLSGAELDAEVRPALSALAGLRPRVLQYKACSTVDSSPTVGSLGRVLELGREAVGERTVPMLFAQPDFGRYTVFGHHFAADDGTVYRLDRQPTMSRHPSTPMNESDLARHLSAQTALAIGGIPLTRYTDAAALAGGIASAEEAAVVLDAVDDRHVGLIGAAIALLPATVFAIGSGGLSAAIAGASPRPRVTPMLSAHSGPVLAVSGSRSPRTRDQAWAAERAGWLVAPLAGGADGDEVAFRALRAGRSVVLTSDIEFAGGDVLDELARRAARVVHAAVAAGETSRVIVCGGDSSTRIVRLLGIASLSISANPWGNVVLLRAHANGAMDGIELVLKGGQVGEVDLFERVRRFAAAS